MRFGVLSILVAMLFLLTPQAAWATGLGGSSSHVARNYLESYCMNHGGTPSGGNCYFPDGGYCELRSFYDGSCPGRGYYEQAIWMNEAYRFLYGDEVYTPAMLTPTSMYSSPSYYPYSYYYPYYQGNYYYWPYYSPGLQYDWL